MKKVCQVPKGSRNLTKCAEACCLQGIRLLQTQIYSRSAFLSRVQTTPSTPLPSSSLPLFLKRRSEIPIKVKDEKVN